LEILKEKYSFKNIAYYIVTFDLLKTYLDDPLHVEEQQLMLANSKEGQSYAEDDLDPL
jgi:hypothetical protein